MSDFAPLGEFKPLFPDDHKYLTFLKKVFRHEFRKSGFRRITTQMRHNGKLRDASEEGIMNVYIENNIDAEIQPVYYYYMSHFFPNGEEEVRIGGDILGENDPILEAILIQITYKVLHKVGLQDKFSIVLNTCGVEKEQTKYAEELTNFFHDKKPSLSQESLALIDTNVRAILASNNEDDKILIENAPKIKKFLKKDSKKHFDQLKEYLDILKIPYDISDSITPEHDYNTHSFWYFLDNSNNNIIAQGARYNKLSTLMDSPKEIPGVGFHAKVEAVINMLRENNIAIRNKDSIDLFFVQLGDDAKKVVLPISLQAREEGINTVVSLGTPAMKEQMLKANRSGAKYIVIVGFMEAKSGFFQVRDVQAGTQEEVKKEELIDYVIKKIGDQSLDFYCPAKDLMKGKK